MIDKEKVVLCHLSDPHVGGRTGSLAVLRYLVEDAVERGADHVLVTGDILERPVKSDLACAIDAFKDAGIWSPGRCTLLPGNHDVSGLPDDQEYGRSQKARREALMMFARATRHVNRPYPGGGPMLLPERPVLKRIGPLSLLCLASVSMEDSSAGSLTGDALLAIDDLLRRRRKETPVVALHHQPYAAEAAWREKLGRFVPPGLEGGAELLSACARKGVKLVLHGHLHTAGGPCDRRIKGIRVSCQGTARGELVSGRRRFGYDMYYVSSDAVRRRRHFFDSADIVDGLLE